MQVTESLFLFKALIKAGCVWRGDVAHRKWSERLFFNDESKPRALEVVSRYRDGEDYHIEDDSIWIR